jgi:hypothetical protein
MTIALIIALVYEILLKLSYILIPSLFHISFASIITSAFFFIVSIVIILFIYFFYKEEKPDNKIELVLKILIGCFIINFILRLPLSQKMIDNKVIRLLGDVVGFINAILLFGFFILYKKKILPGERLISQAIIFVTIMFGIGVIKSLYSLISYARFVASGITVTYSPIFYNIMFILFLVTHLSIINFLYHYYRLKTKVQTHNY